MKTSITLLFITFLFINKGYAQINYPVSNASCYMEIIGNNTLAEDDTIVSPTTQLKGSFVVVLDDTTGISKVHVILGSTNGSSDLFSKAFVFDQAGIFADGTSYLRKGRVLYLGVGNYTGLNKFYGEVKIETNTGGFSTPYKYSN